MENKILFYKLNFDFRFFANGEKGKVKQNKEVKRNC